jgi:hypothetical protein
LIQNWGKKYIACFFMVLRGWMIVFPAGAVQSQTSTSNPVSGETVSIAE